MKDKAGLSRFKCTNSGTRFKVTSYSFIIFVLSFTGNYSFSQPGQRTSRAVSMDTAKEVLNIYLKQQLVLSYQYGTLYPPAGQDTLYKRSGFVHPINTLAGSTLTQIQPPDHYHHYGFWNAWTKVLFEKDTIDFWNLKSNRGTVQFAGIKALHRKKAKASFTVMQHHIAFPNTEKQKTAISENLQVVVQPLAGNNRAYIIDLVATMQCATKSPVHLLKYRYGGYGWRATPYWEKANCKVTTSEKTQRHNTDGIKARWIMAQGPLPDNHYGGMVIMSHPQNYNHPEPLRIWDETSNEGRGDLFVNYSPSKTQDWLLVPGMKYVLRYRLLVFDGSMDDETANHSWEQYAKGLN